MTIENITLYLAIFILCSWLMGIFWIRRNITWLLLTGFFLIRVSTALVLETGLKFNFVCDSLLYERNSWQIAKFWSSSRQIDFLTPANLLDSNPYEVVLAGIFYLFGNSSFVATLFNSVIAVATIYLIFKIYMRFFSDPNDLQKSDIIGRAVLVILGFYPSFVVWSATNIRDPLYFFFCVLLFYFLFEVFSKRGRWYLPAKYLGVAGGILCFFMILG